MRARTCRISGILVFLQKIKPMRYKIVLSYNGSDFCGWQIQNDAPTVQGCLQKALGTLLREEIQVTGAGRTDTGVHAVRYVAHFDSSRDDLGATDFCYKLNAILPRGITVHEAVPAEDGFHARFGARKRSYRYFLHRRKDPFMEGRSYRCGYPLDIEAMNRAAEMILGTHDFSCFEKTGGNNKTSVCTVTVARWETYTPGHAALLGYPAEEGDYLVFTVSADRFLRNMVRAIVGTLIEIGRGRQSPEWMEEVLKKGDRCAAGESVPGYGLYLYEVLY